MQAHPRLAMFFIYTQARKDTVHVYMCVIWIKALYLCYHTSSTKFTFHQMKFHISTSVYPVYIHESLQYVA